MLFRSVDISETIKFHRERGKSITVTAIQPEARFGNLHINNDFLINKFMEKPKTETGWVNGGFFVCSSKVFDYLDDSENCIFEQQPLQKMAADGEMYAYKHNGFWHPMDTLRDNQILNQLWKDNKAPWKIWK